MAQQRAIKEADSKAQADQQAEIARIKQQQLAAAAEAARLRAQ